MVSHGEKRTPMAWQHRDMNYHHGGYSDRYGHGGLELSAMRPGPPSTSDRLSHRTDKSWRTQRDSQGAYPPSRPSYSTGRPPSRPHSAVTSTTNSSSSTSDSDSEEDDPKSHMQPIAQPIYGYEGYYPGYGQASVTGYPPSVSQYPGTLKSAKSVPALGTWDGEPCPVHGTGPLSLPGPHIPPPPPSVIMPPPGAFTLPPPRRAASIYDMRLMPPPSVAPIYGTLPVRPPPPGDRRSMASGPPPGIPPQLLPPMARPRPLVVSEGGTTEPLPVRSPQDKANTLPLTAAAKITSEAANEGKNKVRCRGGLCVGLIVVGVIFVGIILGFLLVFIL